MKLDFEGPGIRAKLNLGVGAVVLVSALTFGALYAFVERATVLGEKQEHLSHVASLARLTLEGSSVDALSGEIDEFSQHLSEATGAPHWIRIEDATGGKLVGRDPDAGRAGPGRDELILWSSLFPSSMSSETPVRLGPGDQSARLIVEESMAGLPDALRGAFARHVAFAALLFGLSALCISLLAQTLVIRPVRELAAATERIGADGSWEPFSPSVRRRDEIGILSDRVADLSRRLFSAIREERYDSAHLVAVGLERGLEEPVHRARLALALLMASLPSESEGARRCVAVEESLDRIVEVGRRLGSVGVHPASSGDRP